MIVTRSTSEPIRTTLSWHQTWEGPDRGLIKCWELGRQTATENPELVASCLREELPVLAWKGGVIRRLKKLQKFGSLNYLAQWQGLRGQDLYIDTTQELTITCNKTGMIVTFTPDHTKYANQVNDTDSEGQSNDRSVSGVSEQSLLS